MISRFVRALAALVALAGLLVGVPMALLRYGRWPLRSLPDRTWIDALNNAVSDNAILSLLTVLMWAIWAAFSYSVIVELVSALRGIHPPRLHLLGPLQRAAHGLVAAVVLALSIHQSMAAAAAATASTGYIPPHARTVAVEQPMTPRVTVDRASPVARSFADTPQSATRTAAATNDSDGRVTVCRGDSAWSLAERHLGEGMRWRELWELNRTSVQPDGRVWSDPQVIVPGWVLALPNAPTPIAAPLPPEVDHDSHEYVVVRGDTLSDIAESELGEARRYPEIFELSRDIEQPGGRHLTDPNLIVAGWTLEIPGDGAAPAEPPATPPVTVVPPAAAEPIKPDPLPTPAPPTTVNHTEVDEPAVTATTLTPSTSATPTASSSPPLPSVAPTDAQLDQTTSSTNALAVLAGVGGSLVLASALSAQMLRWRRLRMSRGVRDRNLTEENCAEIHSAVRAGDVPLIHWAAHELGELVARLDPRRVTGAPEAIELSASAGIEVLWNIKQTEAPESWRVADGGWAWRLDYDEDAHVPKVECTSPFPALVTIGSRDGRQLLLDLEACGTVSVVGPDDRVDDFLRSIATELAVGTDLADAYLDVVGFDLPSEHLGDRIRQTTVDEAATYLRAFTSSVGQAIDAVGLESTFRARLGDTPPIEASVVIVGRDVDGAESLIDTPARRGAAVIFAGEIEGAGARIAIADDGTAHVDDLDVDFVAVSLPASASTAIDETLGELVELFRAQKEPAGSEGGTADQSPEVEQAANEDDTSDPIDAPMHEARPLAVGCPEVDDWPEVIVKVLGTPGVPARPDLQRRETVATVVLACHGKPVASSVIQDALYNDKPTERKTIENVVSGMRKQLGALNDGTLIVPSNGKHKAQLSLDPRVKSDLQLLREALASAPELSSAEALMTLDRAHRLIEGPPFDAVGYSWAYDQHFATDANEVIADATTELVDRALELDMIDVARAATRRAFRALDCHEALYRARMKIEHHAGNPPGIRAAYDELRRELGAVEAAPSEATDRLLRDLTTK